MKSGKPSLWKLGGLSWLDVLKQTKDQLGKDEVAVRSAALSYYFVLAVFPAMLFILSLLGILAAPGSSLREGLMSSLTRVLPGSASDLVGRVMNEVVKASGAGKMLIGAVGALWSASGGVTAMMQSLNVAYEVKETRPWWKQKAVAVGLTIGLAVLVLLGMSLLVFGGRAAEIAGAHGLGSAVVVLWKVVQWPLVLACMFAAFAATYYFAPDLKDPEWHWITPGSAVGLVVWLVASFGFKIYLHFFDSYSKTYGSVAGAIILLLWLYITGFAIMAGGEVNCVIGRAGDRKERHEKRLHEIERDYIKAA